MFKLLIYIKSHSLNLQCRGMIPFITSFRMSRAWGSTHLEDGVELMTTILAGVLGFLRTLIEFVRTLICAIGMAGTWRGCKDANRRELMSAILAIEIFLFHIVALLWRG